VRRPIDQIDVERAEIKKAGHGESG
jgi:hypothetical protein